MICHIRLQKITFEENKNQNNNSADYSEDQHCHNHYYDSKHCHYTHNNYDDNDDNDDNDDPMFETNGKKYYVGSAGGIYSLTPSKNKSYVTGNKKNTNCKFFICFTKNKIKFVNTSKLNNVLFFVNLQQENFVLLHTTI